ncbi:hypothetical protein ACCO45_004987 [Purpureocillium lilacinum]|uniref:Uncharacterized protein n=1 Tax=Purpureocillium lilacinum TaxID=33203 RepID=A0ACC4DX20_PURLI
MIDKSQCPSHTRTPWGRSSHRCDYRLRYLLMGVLVVLFAGVMVLGIVYTFTRGGPCTGEASKCPQTTQRGSVAMIRGSAAV